jgi:hypothetical protein
MCLEIWNDFGPLIWLLPATPVDHQADPDDPSPSLRPHYRASALLRDGPPPSPATVLRPSRRWPLGDLPLAAGPGRRQYRGDRSHVPCKSPGQARAACMPDAIWAVSRLPPDLSRSPGHAPVSTPLRFITTRQQRFASARLPDPHLTRSSPRLFPQRSPQTALNRRSLRWFEASPCRATPEDLPPSLAQHRIQWLLHRTSFSVVAHDLGKRGRT